MDLSSVVRYYVDRMLKEVPGMKVLLLDADTTRIVSTVYSQSEILEQEVYLVERLDADRRDQLFHLKVCYDLQNKSLLCHTVPASFGHLMLCERYEYNVFPFALPVHTVALTCYGGHVCTLVRL